MTTENNNNNVSEYKIGRTTYVVKLVFNPASKERLTDILQRLIDCESEEMLGESGQEPEKQAVKNRHFSALPLTVYCAIMIT